jgi:hypothetical protein
MKFTSLFLTVSGLALARLGLAQASEVPIYRITVVARTTKAISYHHPSGSTRIGFRGTALIWPHGDSVLKETAC